MPPIESALDYTFLKEHLPWEGIQRAFAKRYILEVVDWSLLPLSLTILAMLPVAALVFPSRKLCGNATTRELVALILARL